MKEINKNISRNIKNYLDALDISQVELAKQLECANSTVSMWISGQATPRMDKLDRMCLLFGCERKDLISDYVLTKEEIEQQHIIITFENKFKELNASNRLRLLAYMDRLVELQEKGDDDK